MPEVMFVLKSLAIAVVLMICLQVKMGSTSLENHMTRWIQTSSIPQYLRGVSSGAVLAVRNAAKTTTDFVGSTFGHSSENRAGRLNFEFKRSQRYQEEHSQKDE